MSELGATLADHGFPRQTLLRRIANLEEEVSRLCKNDLELQRLNAEAVGMLKAKDEAIEARDLTITRNQDACRESVIQLIDRAQTAEAVAARFVEREDELLRNHLLHHKELDVAESKRDEWKKRALRSEEEHAEEVSRLKRELDLLRGPAAMALTANEGEIRQRVVDEYTKRIAAELKNKLLYDAMDEVWDDGLDAVDACRNWPCACQYAAASGIERFRAMRDTEGDLT